MIYNIFRFRRSVNGETMMLRYCYTFAVDCISGFAIIGNLLLLFIIVKISSRAEPWQKIYLTFTASQNLTMAISDFILAPVSFC